MRRRTPEQAHKSSKPARSSAIDQKLKILLPPTLASSEAIGIAICDRHLRFRLVNEAWARMDGVTRNDHLGATVQSVLGSAAKQFELAFESVFSSGNPLLGYEFSAYLPTRTEEAYWITSCFPVKGASEKLTLAAATLLDITPLRRLENWSNRLLADSVRILETLFATKGLFPNKGRTDDRSSGPPTSAIKEPNLEELSGGPMSASEKPRLEELSPREREVIQLLALSKGNKEIATALGISTRTIETYRARIMLKLRVHSISELVHYAIRTGIVEPRKT
jgi:DNA-binding CsgD family transcriptional regulator